LVNSIMAFRFSGFISSVELPGPRMEATTHFYQEPVRVIEGVASSSRWAGRSYCVTDKVMDP
jgi:hypothetical protein